MRCSTFQTPHNFENNRFSAFDGVEMKRIMIGQVATHTRCCNEHLTDRTFECSQKHDYPTYMTIHFTLNERAFFNQGSGTI